MEFSNAKIPFLFYTCTPRDYDAFQLIQKRIIKENGVFTKEAKAHFDKNPVKLNEESISEIQKLLEKNIHINGRFPSNPLKIDTSIKEMALATNENFQSKYGHGVRLLLNGGSLWPLLKPFILELLSTFSLKPGTLFQSSLDCIPNDIDWQFNPQISNLKDYKPPNDEGIVQLFAKKIECNEIKPSQIVKELTRTKIYSDNHPDNSYLAHLFKGRKSFDVKQVDLLDLFVRVRAFERAAEVNNPNSTVFSLLTIGSEMSHDCFFPVKITEPIVRKHSLYIDATPLLFKPNQQLYLSSFCCKPDEKPKVKVLQAIIDSQLGNITFKTKGVVNHLSFSLTISWYTQGTKSLKIGWLEKTLLALIQEKLKTGRSLAKIFCDQLISRLRHHHHNELEMLIALTFNASAIFLESETQDQSEIKQIWTLILKYVDLVRNRPNYHSNTPSVLRLDPLLIAIEKAMQNPDLAFIDVYYFIQAISSVMPHCQSTEPRKYECLPTQNEGKLFSQIEVTSPKYSEGTKKTFDLCMLFFPFKLLEALKHLRKLAVEKSSIFHLLGDLHKNLIDGNELTFSIEKSPLKAYNHDPRRKISDCMTETLSLLNRQDENFWLLGYQLGLSLLAQKEDQSFLKDLIEKQISMLCDSWASEKFKASINSLFHRFLTQSNFKVKPEFFSKWEKQEIVKDLFSIQKEPFISIAWRHYYKLEAQEDNPTLVSIYTNFFKSFLAPLKWNSEAIKNGEVRKNFKRLIDYMTLPGKFIASDSLKWILALHNNQFFRLDLELESIILKGLINILRSIKSVSKEINKKNLFHLQKTSLILIQNTSARILAPDETRLFNKIITERNFFTADQEDAFKKAFVEFFKSYLEQTDSKSNVINDLDEIFLAGGNNQQMIPLIKTAIENRLSKTECKNSSQEIDTILLLLESLFETENCWNERMFIIQTLSTIVNKVPSLNNFFMVDHLLQKYHDLHSQMSIDNLLGFYFYEQNHHNVVISCTLLKLIFDLFHRSPNHFSNKQLALCANYFIACHSNEHNRNTLEKISLEVFLTKLHTCEQWDPILRICTLEPKLQNTNLDSLTGILVNAFHAKIHMLKAPTEVKDCDRNIFEILLKNLKLSVLDIEMKEKLSVIIEIIIESAWRDNELQDALNFLNKFKSLQLHQNKFYWESCFNLLERFAFKGNSKEINGILGNFNPPGTYEDLWQNLYLVLLENEQIEPCLKILEKRIKLVSTDNWTIIYDKLTKLSLQNIEKNDERYKDQLSQLASMMQLFLLQFNPKTSKPWLSYMTCVFNCDDIKKTQKIFYWLNSKTFSMPIKPSKKVDCLLFSLEMLAREGTEEFLNIELWWVDLWNALPQGSIDTKVKLLTFFIKGTANACRPLINLENGFQKNLIDKRHRLQSHNVKKLTSAIQHLIQILNLNEFQDLKTHIDDIEILIDLFHIYWTEKSDESYLKALHVLILIFSHDDPDIQKDEYLVKVFETCLNTLKNSNNIELLGITYALTSIFRTWKNYNPIPFTILEFTNKTLKFYIGNRNDDYIPTCFFNELVVNCLTSILKIPEKDLSKISREEIDIVKWGYEYLYRSQNIYHIMGFNPYNKQNDLHLYINKKQFHKFDKPIVLVDVPIALVDLITQLFSEVFTFRYQIDLNKELIFKSNFRDRSKYLGGERFGLIGRENTRLTKVAYTINFVCLALAIISTSINIFLWILIPKPRH